MQAQKFLRDRNSNKKNRFFPTVTFVLMLNVFHEKFCHYTGLTWNDNLEWKLRLICGGIVNCPTPKVDFMWKRIFGCHFLIRNEVQGFNKMQAQKF